ncbi:MAG TPA: exosortase/archaeosortase family protein [Kiritimatiellia bacterium]|nr:exosortase/archaeosortase family protein [Kiritimatiellia bacterium]HMO98141.1 exosortase/archaeosortase family protein [Kiritimatiellia bacterium]HMP96197.1 exosortase/archaeosortase family protein [Kiritimatiellia bacterium]
MESRSPTSRLPLAALACLSTVAGLIYAQFHLFGNTTEINVFGRSAFGWMLDLWRSGRIFGGSVYYLGWAMPAVVLLLLYVRRRELAAAPRAIFWPGLAVVVLALLMHWAGARAQQTRLSLIALIVLIWGIPLFLYGWSLARRLLFPVGLLIFCVPLNFLDAVTFPMRIVSAQIAAGFLNGIGIAVGRSGSALLAPAPATYAVDGADPASGLGTLLTLAAIVAIAGYLRRDRAWVLIFTAGALIPAMIMAGALRLTGSVIGAEILGPDTALLLHRRAGLVVMLVLTLLLLAGIRVGLRRLAAMRRAS